MKTIKNITTTIPGDFAGSLSVTWNLDYYYDTYEIHIRHDKVSKVLSVKYLIFDKVAVILTEKITGDRQLNRILEAFLLESVQDKEPEEIVTKTPESLFEKLGNIARQDALNRFGIKL